MKKILILYTSIGHGHKAISENIAAALKNNFQVDLVDLLKLEQGTLMDGGAELYTAMVKHWPGLWKFFYTNKVFLKSTLPLRVPVASFKFHKVLKLLRENDYDAVICAHVNASAIISYLKKNHLYKGKFIIAFSDFHLHPYWVFKNADLFLANIEEQKQQMVASGIPAEKILVCGMTLPPKKEFDPAWVRKKYGLAEKDRLVLVMSGSKGLIFDPNLIERLKTLDAKIFVVCGKNDQLEKYLTQRFAGQANVRIFGYHENLPELYAITDIVVTKPGGLTVSECLQYGLTMLIHAWLPGQEELNFEYLQRNHLILAKPGDLRSAVAHELASGEFAAQLRGNPKLKEIVQDGALIKRTLTELL